MELYFLLHKFYNWEYDSKFLLDDKFVFGKLVILLTIGIYTLLGRRFFSGWHCKLCPIGLYMGLCTSKSLASEMLTPCHGDRIKWHQVTITLSFCMATPFHIVSQPRILRQHVIFDPSQYQLHQKQKSSNS